LYYCLAIRLHTSLIFYLEIPIYLSCGLSDKATQTI
jgi:hypothetical protein